jgi:hypothetical protein
MDEQYLRILWRNLLDEGPETEGRREHDLGTVELDHALHYALDLHRLGHTLLLD